MPDVWLAALAVAPLASVELAKAARWQSLFGAPRPPLLRCLRAIVSGQLANALSPVRAGDALRLGVMAAEGSAVVPATASLVAVKAVDAVCLLAIALLVVGRDALGRATLPLALAVGVAIGCVVLLARGSTLRTLADRWTLTRRLRLATLVDVADSLRQPATLWRLVWTTAVVWAAGLAANVVVLSAVGIEPSLDLAARMLVAGYLVGLVPAPPARLGVFEAGITVALTTAGVPLADALAAAVVLHVCQMLELLLLLSVGLLAKRWSWSA